MHLTGTDVNVAFPSFTFKQSILKLLIERLEYHGNKVAQIEDKIGKNHTFADILQQSKSISAGLSKSGVTVGDYVIICCNKSSLAFSLQLGVMFTGATAVLIKPQDADNIHTLTRGYVIKAVFCEMILLHSVNQSLNQKQQKPTIVATSDAEDTTMKLLLSATDEFTLYEVKDIKKHVPLILFTSGSTGECKGVQISDLGVQRLGYSYVDESIKSFLQTNTFSWISSTISLVSSILKGYTLILSESREPSVHLQLIERYKINGWTLSADKVNSYAKEPSLSSVDLSSVTLVNIGGAVIMKRVIELFIERVLKGRTGLHVIYGMTEVGLVTTWRNINLLDLSKANSSGYLAPGVEIKIVDEEGKLVMPGNMGEVLVKSLSTMVGYWRCQEPDSRTFDSDGFFRTGDAGYFDNDGFLYITGRANEIVTYAGSKMSVSEVEDLLKARSDIVDAAVVAKACPPGDFHLVAFIVVKPDCIIQKEDVTNYIAGHVEETKKLKGVHVVEAIPRTASGKVHRDLLRSMLHDLDTVN